MPDLRERVLIINITEQAAGRTVRQFLIRDLSLGPHQISRLKFTRDGICVNGERVYVTKVLRAGDELKVRLTLQKEPRDTQGAKPPKIWEEPSADISRFPFTVLYEDEDLLIVNKPSGIVCHPSPGHYADTLANQAAVYLGAVGTAMDIRVTGRLDRETSGIVTFAKNAEAAALIQKQRREGTLEKEYLALVDGIPDPAEGVADMPLRREYPGSFKMTAAPDGKPARTFYRTLKTLGREASSDSSETSRALLSCTIEHGRTHQIRVHLASLGHPITCDRIYGNPEQNCGAAGDDAICLHAYRLRFRQPFTGEVLEVSAPYPVWA